MASTFRLQSGWRYAAGGVLAVTAVVGIVYARAWKSVAEDVAPVDAQGGSVTATPHDNEMIAPKTWSVFVSSQTPQGHPGNVPSAERFRLAGTFAIESASGARLQKAILDDAQRNEQKIVGEGDVLDGITVEAIRYDRVTLRTPTGTKDLVLEFASLSGDTAGGDTNRISTGTQVTSNRFNCIKVKDDRWQFSRQPLLDYYQELLDEPDRMVAIFDTMKPVRNEQNRITGYVVGIEGEKDFFDAVGLHEGDIVRQVNSVAMTNRRRAEFFIDEFLKNRMNAVVLDVERDGKVQKQVYQLKE